MHEQIQDCILPPENNSNVFNEKWHECRLKTDDLQVRYWVTTRVLSWHHVLAQLGEAPTEGCGGWGRKGGDRRGGRRERTERRRSVCAALHSVASHSWGYGFGGSVCVCVFPKEVHLQQIFVYNRSIFWLVFTVQGQVSTFPNLSMH